MSRKLDDILNPKDHHSYETLDEAAEAIDDIRGDLIFASEAFTNLSPIATQYFLLAVASLESAIHQLKIGHLESKVPR